MRASRYYNARYYSARHFSSAATSAMSITQAKPLTKKEVTDVVEITGEASGTAGLSYVKSLTDSLIDEQLIKVRDYIAEWLPVRRDFVSISGGRDGVNLNAADDRAAIRYDMRKLLGLPAYVQDSSSMSGGGGYSVSIPVTTVW